MHPSDVQHASPSFTSPNGLSVRWLGTAGYELVAPEGPVLLIDPYVTRVGLWRYLTGTIDPDVGRIGAAFTRADGILVGHSHFDHVMDVPVIAQRSGAHVWGSRRFDTRDDSRNSWWVALLTFGEGWHNNHHAFPTSARHGLTWYELDPNWIGIRTLQTVGLAWDVNVPKGRLLEPRKAETF